MDETRHSLSAYRLRILLLEASRYRALIIEREIARRFTSAVLTRFESPRDALHEARNNNYDIMLVDYLTAHDTFSELLFSLRASNPEVVLIAFGPEDIPRAQMKGAETWADGIVTAYERIHHRLPEMISRFAERWQRTGMVDDEEGILDAPTRSAVIGCTVRTLAHEVNNPLMTILGTTELLLSRREDLTDAQREKVEMIRQSAGRIQDTLSELAKLSGDVLRRSPVGPLLGADTKR